MLIRLMQHLRGGGGQFPLKTVEFKNTHSHEFGRISIYADDLIASGVDFPTGADNATIGFVTQVLKKNGEVMLTSICPVSIWVSNGYYTFANGVSGVCGGHTGTVGGLSNVNGSANSATSASSAYIYYSFLNSSLTYDEEICSFSYCAIEA